MSEPMPAEMERAVDKTADPRWNHEVTEGGLYDSLGNQIIRLREGLNALRMRLGTVLEVELSEPEVKLAVGPDMSPLRKQIDDFASLNHDLETLIRRIEL